MGYSYVPDGPLGNMRAHAEKELAEWERSVKRNETALESSRRMVDHWRAEFWEIDAELAARKETRG